jgi:hypothetical protein
VAARHPTARRTATKQEGRLTEDWAAQRLAELRAAAPIKRKKPEFVRVPLHLIGKAAAATGGKRMLVWILILHQSWRRRTPAVTVTNDMLRTYGISRETKRRALEQLEAVGLISVQWRANKNPIATLVE